MAQSKAREPSLRATVDADPMNEPAAWDREKASGGSRTHNPRITNAVLCQLKLRWQWQLMQLI